MLALLVGLGVASVQARTSVLFSYGAVETLRAGETRWDFLSADATVGPDDIVRMPPGALLRLQDDAGRRLRLLSGIGEGTAAKLLEIADAQATEEGAAYSGSAEAAAVDVLPAGAAGIDGRDEATTFALNEAAAAAWLADKSHESNVLREAAQRAVANAPLAPAYMPEHLAKAKAVFAYVHTDLGAGGPVASTFADDTTRPVYAVAALLAAAGIPTRRYVDADGRPFILLGAGLRRSQVASMTASRSMYRTRPDGSVEIALGLAPGQTTLLEAWYAGSGLDIPGQ